MEDNRPTRDARAFNRRIKDARIGNPAAQYDVGLMYANGTGVERSVEEALVWFKAAAKKGHASAQYLLGSAFANGVGTTKDELLALQWFLQAGEQGNPKALLKLARLVGSEYEVLEHRSILKAATLGAADAQWMAGQQYREGKVVPRDAGRARSWFEKAAAQGYAPAQYALGKMHAEGDGMPADPNAAAPLYRAASAQGLAAAQIALSQLDEVGYGRSAEAKRRARKAGAKERRQADERWAQAAESGDPDDRYHLGLMYQSGIGVNKNLQQARKWIQRAATQGHVKAQLAMARLCEPGDAALAATWYERAAQAGHADAQFAMGRLCETGEGVRHDAVKALSWYVKAADQLHAEALLALADILKRRDEDAALICYEAAATQGAWQAQFAMGEAYRSGATLAQDWERAAHWFKLAAAQGSAEAECALAELHADGKGVEPDQAEALFLYEKAAAKNHPRAQWLLGSLLAAGGKGIKPDPKQASLWCKRAASAGYAPAQATLGNLFAQAKRYDRAAFWWAKAEAQDDPEAGFNLANAYRVGRGVALDLARSFQLMLKVAEAGVAAAQVQVGLMYATGEGVAQDPIEATKWFLIAAAAGHPLAQANSERAKERFDAWQLAEAGRRAQVWLMSRQKKH